MANPDYTYDINTGSQNSDSGWFSILVLIIVLFNIFVFGSLVVGAIFPSYKNSGAYKFIDEMMSRLVDNSTQCRYAGDCTLY